VNTIYLLLGSNEGNSFEILASARDLLSNNLGNITSSSLVYETEAWGNTHQPNFLNQAILIKTDQNPFEAIDTIQKIEHKMGRERKEHWGQRTIDIDILFYNNDIIHSSRLVIPHPEIQNRKFALIPLSTICGDYVHPILKQSIPYLLTHCKDQLDVRPYPSN
jgi:2-amino-4-hydroxy-6-hydroxymethyldihydropteridine diphosphokinase